jgi:hypothetical protein
VLALAARARWAARLVATLVHIGQPVARRLGRERGLLAYEIQGAGGEAITTVFSGRESFLMAVLPATLASARLARGDAGRPGVVPVDAHVPARDLLEALGHHGIEIGRAESIGPAGSRR